MLIYGSRPLLYKHIYENGRLPFMHIRPLPYMRIYRSGQLSYMCIYDTYTKIDHFHICTYKETDHFRICTYTKMVGFHICAYTEKLKGLCMMPWSPCFNLLTASLSSVLLWVHLQNQPLHFWGEPSLNSIGFVLGKFPFVSK